ncbi:MAG TPA: alpha/beta hydrolase [Limnobacter sp.]|nr:alpha/beta hydrolase [Limnobacter sp.]
MLTPTCITVPGLHGSGPGHWQTWAEYRIPNCRRVRGIDFHKPVIAAWADAIRNDIRSEAGSVILIAHSFGCLASVVAIADNNLKVAGVVFVAPASPERFSISGLSKENDLPSEGLLNAIPASLLGVPGILIASTNDPWMKVTQAQYWAEVWGLRFTWIQNAGHINTESGYGRWPGLERVVVSLRDRLTAVPLGEIHEKEGPVKNRFSALVKLRQLTRESIE